MNHVYVTFFMDGDTPIFDGASVSLAEAKRIAQAKYDEGIERDHGPVQAEILKWVDLPDREGADCDHDNGQWLVEIRIRRVPFSAA